VDSEPGVTAQPLVSVVTPFYNTRSFLAECIESVLRQTYTNWEYIVVDNSSTDGSGDLAADYAARFPDKIRLIRTTSLLPQVQNYNFALSCISPDSVYCKMVQADDFLFPHCLEHMVDVAEEHRNVGIVSAYELEGRKISLDGLPFPSRDVPGREVCRMWFIEGEYFFGTPTSILFRSSLVRSREPFFNEKYAPFEDTHVCFDLLRSCDFGFVHEVLTFSRRDNESILEDARRLGALYFIRFSTLILHGQSYLSQTEYIRLLRRAKRAYFTYLGQAVWKLENVKFWEFHRKRFASIDCRLDWRILIPWALVGALEYAGNPKSTFGAILRRGTRQTNQSDHQRHS